MTGITTRRYCSVICRLRASCKRHRRQTRDPLAIVEQLDRTRASIMRGRVFSDSTVTLRELREERVPARRIAPWSSMRARPSSGCSRSHSQRRRSLLTAWAGRVIDRLAPGWSASEIANLLYRRTVRGELALDECARALGGLAAATTIRGNHLSLALRAMRIAQSGRKVTCIIFPNDLQEMNAVEEPPRKHGTVHSGVGFTSPRVVPDDAALRQAADVLNAGSKVAILVGAGALRHQERDVPELGDPLGRHLCRHLAARALDPGGQSADPPVEHQPHHPGDAEAEGGEPLGSALHWDRMSLRLRQNCEGDLCGGRTSSAATSMNDRRDR